MPSFTKGEGKKLTQLCELACARELNHDLHHVVGACGDFRAGHIDEVDLDEVLLYSGRPDGAIFSLETALRFDPLMDPAQLTHLGLAYYLKGRYEDAAKILERVSGLDPDYLYAHTILAAVYGQMDLQANAARAAHAVRRLNPFFSTDEFRSRSLFRDPADAARVDEGLRKAGLD